MYKWQCLLEQVKKKMLTAFNMYTEKITARFMETDISCTQTAYYGLFKVGVHSHFQELCIKRCETLTQIWTVRPAAK